MPSRKDYMREYRKLPEQIERSRLRAAEFRAAHPDKAKDRTTAARRKNPAKYRAMRDKFKAANPERHRQQQREWDGRNPHKLTASVARRRAHRLLATPPWADNTAMRTVYKKAAEWGMQVDHVVPLRSPIVSGLHCEANLQLLVELENKSKSNKHWPDMP